MPRDSRVTSEQIGAELQYKREVMLLEDCEGTMKWTVTGTGADFAATHDTTASYMGTKGLKMVTRATSPDTGDQCLCVRQLCFPHAKKLVMRARVSLPNYSTMDMFCFCLTILDGEHSYRAGLNYSPNQRKVFYRDSANQWAELAGYGQVLYDGFWTILEYVLDLDAHEYIHILFNGKQTDMAGVKFHDVGALTNFQLKLDIGITAYTEGQTELNVDSIYIGELEHI